MEDLNIASFYELNEHSNEAYHEIKQMLEALPVVDAVPVVHGWWIKEGYIEHTWLVSKCSVCGGQTIDAGMYCTNCGALMDERNGERHD